MKTFSIISIFFIVTMLFASCDDQSLTEPQSTIKGSYFPYEIGNKWTYFETRISNGTTLSDTTTWEIVEKQVTTAGRSFRIQRKSMFSTGDNDTINFFWRNDSLYLFNNNYRPVLAQNMKTGDVLFQSTTDPKVKCTVEEIGANVTVKGKKYSNVIKLSETNKYSPEEIPFYQTTQSYFAAGIGYIYDEIKGGDSYLKRELIEYKLVE